MLPAQTFLLALLVVSATCVQPEAPSKHWAVLVAGSNTYFNYRHQADVCHAYQVMKKHGIPDENIIVMMYDDIAYNDQNPTQGVIINQPDGPNVYKGVPKDYTGKAVNPGAFLSILQGDAVGARQYGGNGKVLRSGPNDHVFIYFTDHGSNGILGFPSAFLHVRQLHNAILNMHEKKMYKKMVIYVEACESGSMFIHNRLPKDINVYATTAANSTESSWACYFDEYRNAYLGDVYSVNWMQDSDKENLKVETLKKQFDIVRNETTTSNVEEFGDLTIGDMTVAEFQGEQEATAEHHPHPCPHPKVDAIPSDDVPLVLTEKKLAKAKTLQERKAAEKELFTLLEGRKEVVRLFKDILSSAWNHSPHDVARTMSEHRSLTNLDCYEAAVDHLAAACPGMRVHQNGFALRHFYTLANLCEEPMGLDVILESISKAVENRPYCQ